MLLFPSYQYIHASSFSETLLLGFSFLVSLLNHCLVLLSYSLQKPETQECYLWQVTQSNINAPDLWKAWNPRADKSQANNTIFSELSYLSPSPEHISRCRIKKFSERGKSYYLHFTVETPRCKFITVTTNFEFSAHQRNTWLYVSLTTSDFGFCIGTYLTRLDRTARIAWQGLMTSVSWALVHECPRPWTRKPEAQCTGLVLSLLMH